MHVYYVRISSYRKIHLKNEAYFYIIDGKKPDSLIRQKSNTIGQIKTVYTQWISRCIAAARERIPGSIDNYVTGVSECSQQRSNLKDDGYKASLN
ncbi:hypothetical protein [Photorhabdus africana]|uniref:hypothetical protein n=1 Tax=Photorhabdus africana TaxID=3097554 RepID=UPI002B401C62|nr:hypothetical protein [Photorhabdus sp. CRI-LC]